MINSRIALILGFLIFALITFDAFQQKFYLDTFNLYTSSEITFFDLLFNHFQRWLIWTFFSICYGIVAWKEFSGTSEPIPQKSWSIVLSTTLVSNFGALLTVSMLTILTQGSEFSFRSFFELFEFILYQKGLNFLFASCLLVLLLYNKSNKLVIDAQWVEIRNLKSTSNTFPSLDNPSLSIKIGNKIKLIHLNEVIWIESDDYCVKVHTSQKSFTMRKSLKSLQKELAPYQFVRVHRKALVNLNYLEHINYNSAFLKLKNDSEIPISKSGTKTLKEALAVNSI